MLTIFTIPKPFQGHIGVIQSNAIRSWVSLRPACEVILFGNEGGTAEFASELGLRHVSDVECSEYGTPLVSSIFNIAQAIASYEIMCYVNADIILISDFLLAVRRVDKRPFLMVGQRWDLELKEPVDFNQAQWESWLRDQLAERGKLHPKSGIDYFVFPRGLYQDIPPFAIGRGGWDNWLIYRARSLKVPVIDATEVITAIHQNHDYSHVPGGKSAVWEGPERRRNRQLTRYGEYAFTLDHATWRLSSQGMKRALSLRHLYFHLCSVPVLVPRLHFLTPFIKGLTRLIGFA
jgi:hypothetical protein